MRSLALLLSCLQAVAAAARERPSLTVAPEPRPALRRLGGAESLSSAAAERRDFAGAREGAEAAFAAGSTGSDAPPGRIGPAGRSDARLPRAKQPPSVGSGRSVPGVYAAEEGGEGEEEGGGGKKASKAEAPPHMAWDWDGTAKTAAVAFGAALIGFAIGGPIGACVGFLAGMFLGGLAWRIGVL